MSLYQIENSCNQVPEKLKPETWLSLGLLPELYKITNLLNLPQMILKQTESSTDDSETVQ